MTSQEDTSTERHGDPADTIRTATSFGVPRIGPAPRTLSHQGLMQDAAPMSGSDSGPYHEPGRDSAGATQQDPDDIWSPPLTGRTLAGMSSAEPSPNLHHHHHQSTSWGRLSKKSPYWRRGDTGDLGQGHTERDLDTLSLDSFQMHDEGHQGEGNGSHEPDHHLDKKALIASGYPVPRPSKPPANVKLGRTSATAVWLLAASIYSTVMSGVWLGAAIAQPRWGTTVSSHGAMTLSTASLVTAILAKTIEMSFVTVFVAFIGQVLTRRAITAKEGMTLSEMSMRTWITQPGSLLTNGRQLRYAGRTVLGGLTLVATIVVIFYTTASNTMVAPKLQWSDWKPHYLKSYIKTSYANSEYIAQNCATPVTSTMDPVYWNQSCLDVQHAGNSWPDLLNFLSDWKYTSNASPNMAERPQVESMLHDNVTIYGTWIETQFSNVSASFETWSRIVNNVSLAMPHPGVYTAAVNESMNSILQPSDLDGIGSYNVSGSVVSPAANVLCVNMAAEELAPLVYTAWPHANTTPTGVGNQTQAMADDWTTEVPVYSENEWLNSTVVDEIFRWGKKYQRRPPVFELFPNDANMFANDSMWNSPSVYFIGKSGFMDNYTVCELRSWPAIQCSTRFDVNGRTGMALSAECSQDVDYYRENATAAQKDDNPHAYFHQMNATNVDDVTSDVADWKWFAQSWIRSLYLSGGLDNNNGSASRILTECALRAPQLSTSLPSMAEGFAALLANTLVTSAVDSPFVHYWDYAGGNVLAGDGVVANFSARVRSQEYASWHSEDWQGLFYVVMAACFLLNLLCLAYLCRAGLVKDFLEPTSLFAIATSATGGGAAKTKTGLAREGGGGDDDTQSMLAAASRTSLLPREKAQLVVPYRLAYRKEEDNFVFEEAAGGGGGGDDHMGSSGVELEDGMGSKRKRHSRLSARALF